jgi:hypothetical protein
MINLTLALHCLRTPHAVSNILRDVVEGADVESNGRFHAGALTVQVRRVDHPITAEVLADVLGMPANVEVWFAIDNKSAELSYVAARAAMTVAAAQLAVLADAEAALLYEYERVLMRRVAGELTVFDWWPEWSAPAVRARFPAPWTITSETGQLD